MHACLREKGYYVWGGCVTRDDAGRCHMLYARWPMDRGFDAWVTDSEIAHAVAEDPLGPFEPRGVVLPARGRDYWDGLCTHNPTVLRVDGRYYLYYMGTRGSASADAGLNWSFRNNQRIGVAVAERPEGPWQRHDRPLIDCREASARGVCCSNASVLQRCDGSMLMIYKVVGDRLPGPFFGPVEHRAAVADGPTGPFVTEPEPIFSAADAVFAAEDPFIWRDAEGCHAIIKDMGGYFTPHGKALVRFHSADGFDWRLTREPLITAPELHWSDGRTQPLAALERPQLYCDESGPRVLYCAARPDGQSQSFNVHIPLSVAESSTRPSPEVIVPDASKGGPGPKACAAVESPA